MIRKVINTTVELQTTSISEALDSNIIGCICKDGCMFIIAYGPTSPYDGALTYFWCSLSDPKRDNNIHHHTSLDYCESEDRNECIEELLESAINDSNNCVVCCDNIRELYLYLDKLCLLGFFTVKSEEFNISK